MELGDNSFINYLQCLLCGNGLSKIDNNKIICETGHEFKIDDGVFVLEENIKLDEKFAWGPKLRDPNENLNLDINKSVMAKESTKKRMSDSLDFIIKEIKQVNKFPVLDIATGRGLLMRRLINNIHNSTIFISDLDANVLVGTNKLLNKLNHDNKLIPIQASATHLPFKNNSFPAITCYGVNNIRDIVKAFSDIYRVLQNGGKFFLTFSLIEKGSASYNWLLTQEDKPGPFDIINGWEEEISKIGFKYVQNEVLFDGPTEKVALDLLPVKEGERGQDIGLVLEK